MLFVNVINRTVLLFELVGATPQAVLADIQPPFQLPLLSIHESLASQIATTGHQEQRLTLKLRSSFKLTFALNLKDLIVCL